MEGINNKPVCPYDGQCYRKNPKHFIECAHPVQFPPAPTPPPAAPIVVTTNTAPIATPLVATPTPTPTPVPTHPQPTNPVAMPPLAEKAPSKRDREPDYPQEDDNEFTMQPSSTKMPFGPPSGARVEPELPSVGNLGPIPPTLVSGDLPYKVVVVDDAQVQAAKVQLEAMYPLSFPLHIVKDMLHIINTCVAHYSHPPRTDASEGRPAVDFGALGTIPGITLVGPFEALFVWYYASGTQAVSPAAFPAVPGAGGVGDTPFGDTNMYIKDLQKWCHWRFKQDPVELQTIIVPTSLVKTIAPIHTAVRHAYASKFSDSTFASVNVPSWEIHTSGPSTTTPPVLMPNSVSHVGLWRDDPLDDAVRCKKSVAPSNPVQPGITEAYIRKEGDQSASYEQRLRPCGTALGAYMYYLLNQLIFQFGSSAQAVEVTNLQQALLYNLGPTPHLDVVAAKAHRHKHVMGSLFNGMSGIIVPYDAKADLGYRPPNLSYHKLRQYCARINGSQPGLNKKEREEFDREMQFVDISNDECDFGMGLETGMNMWHCARFDPAPAHSLSLMVPTTLVLKNAVRILTLAYTLLDRDTYIHILNCHVGAFCSYDSNPTPISNNNNNTTASASTEMYLHFVVARSRLVVRRW